jgi:hypothetical protein
MIFKVFVDTVSVDSWIWPAVVTHAVWCLTVMYIVRRGTLREDEE